MTDAPIYARFILIDSGMRITPCILCSPNRRRLYIIIILDLALATPRVLPVGPSACKSLSRISIPSGLYNYIFLVFIGFIVLHFSIICFVNSSVIQPFRILLQWVLISSQKKKFLKEVPLSRQIFVYYHTKILLFPPEIRKQLQGLRKRTALDFAGRKMMPHLKMRWRG